MSTATQLYLYTGPLSSVSLRVASRIVDVQLHPNKPVTLPVDHPYTQALLAQQRLTPVVPAAHADDAPVKAPRHKGALS